MKKIIEKPIGYIFILVVAVMGGLYTALTLPISMYPSIQKPKIGMWIRNQGMNTVEAYETYIESIRSSLKSVEDAEKTEISFYTGHIGVVIDFDYSMDRDEAKRSVAAAFESFRGTLPEDVRQSYWVGFEEQNQGEFAGMFFSKEQRSPESIYNAVNPLLESRIGEVKDVDLGSSGLYRIEEKQITVEFNELELAKYGLFLPDVLNTIRAQVRNFPSGKIVSDRHTIFIRTVLSENKIQNFKDIVLKTTTVNSGVVSSVRVIRLSDVAKVFLDKKPARRMWRAEGKPANMLTVKAVPGGHLWQISHGIKSLLREIRGQLPEDILFRKYLDPSDWVSEAIRNMLVSAVIGTLIAVLVILLFLGSFKSTLLIGISIPSSLVLSVIAMKAVDININMISLGGMALAVGMIVDSSIVVLENIFRTFEERTPAGPQEKIQAIVDAVAEVKWPVVVSTLTSIIVFLPLSFTSAMANAILGDMSLVVVFALVISVAAALIYLPIFARLLFAVDSRKNKVSERWSNGVSRVCDRLYLRLLSHLMRRKLWAGLFCLFSFLLLGGISATLIGQLKKEIVAEPEAMIMRANLHGKYVTGHEEMLKLVLPFEKIVEQPRYKEKISGYVTEIREKRGSIRILLNKDSDPVAFEKMMEKDFQSTPEVRVRVKKWNPTSLPIPDVQDAVVVFNPNIPADFDDAVFLCSELNERMEKEESPFKYGWCEPWSSVRKEVQVLPDKFKLQRMAHELGLRVSGKDLSDYIQVASDQKYLGEVFFKGEATKVYGKYSEGTIRSAEDVGNIAISLGREGTKSSYSLKTFAKVRSQSVPPMVKVVNGARNIVAYGGLKFDFREKKKEAQAWLAGQIEEIRKKYPEHRAVISQQNPYVDVDKSISSLNFSLVLSLVLILSVLVLQFHSIKQSLIIMLAIPLGIFGVVISLYVFGSTLSLNSMLGVILLAGVAVNNSILVVDFFNSIRRSGVGVRDAILRSVQIRFRPIMMTMMTTIFAMLPIAMSLGAGGKTLQPLGVAVSGGLLVSTVFTLIVVPLTLFLVSSENDLREERI